MKLLLALLSLVSAVWGLEGDLSLTFRLPGDPSPLASTTATTTWAQDLLLMSHFLGLTHLVAFDKLGPSDMELLNHPSVPRAKDLYDHDKLLVVLESSSSLDSPDLKDTLAPQFKTPGSSVHKEDYLEQMDQIGAFFPGHLIDMGRVVTRLLDGIALKENLSKEFGMTVDLFDEASREDVIFMTELTEFPRLAMQPGNSIVRFKSLEFVAIKYGQDSQKYATARALLEKQVKIIVESGLENKKAVMVLQTPHLSFFQTSSGSSSPSIQLFARAADPIPKDETACPSSKAACETTFGNCSSHGTCTQQRDPRGGSGKCWTCLCNINVWTDDNGKPVEGFSSPVHWTGNMCQFQDISTSFQIVFWVSLALILLLTSVIGMMLGIDQGDSFSGNPFEHRSKDE